MTEDDARGRIAEFFQIIVTCQRYLAVAIEPVSTNRLLQNGNFCGVGQRLSADSRQSCGFRGLWRLEPNAEIPRKMQAFRAKIDHTLRSSECVAGAEGIEPPRGGIQVRHDAERNQACSVERSSSLPLSAEQNLRTRSDPKEPKPVEACSCGPPD